TPTFNTPGGPAVEQYFDDAQHYTELYDQLLAGGPDRADAIEALLDRVAGGREVERLVTAGGKRFAGCTIRSLPEGQRIIVHADLQHAGRAGGRAILRRRPALHRAL